MKLIVIAILLFWGLYSNAQICYQSNRFSYSSNECDSKMVLACKKADSILNLPMFWNAIRNFNEQEITNSNYSMARLCDTLSNYKDITKLELKKNEDHGVVTAVTGQANLTIIYKAGYENTIDNLALTIIHEWVHSVDYGVNKGKLQFAHRRPQYPWWNKNTASYRIEKIAKSFL